ncbi:hypothetical protein HZB03_05030 [Candidatus Woesearchaeota archaeon]|nr:hypothetical protein [Candidatus Woesearchaeota archaeon]
MYGAVVDSMKVYFVGKVDRQLVKRAIAVASQLIKVPAGLEIYAVESPRKFHLVLRRLPYATQSLVKQAFSLNKISFSTQVRGRKIIVLVLNRAMLQNPDALVGLLLHELTHIKQQNEGLTDYINQAFQKAFLSKVAHMHHPRFSADALVKTFVELGLISTLLLKDLYATTALIESGYERYVVAHYKSRFSDNKLCQAPINLRLLHRLVRRDLDLLVSAARVEAYVAAVFLPLCGMKTKQAKELRKFIEMCYPTQVKDCEQNCRPLMRLYAKEFSYSQAFCNNFFKVMLERFIKEIK